MKRLVVASTNEGKVREVRAALADLKDWSVDGLPEGFPEIEETGESFVENATVKAMHYSRLVPGFTLADDSGLSVHALNGRPGVHSARYAPDAAARNARLLSELDAQGVEGNTNRDATFYCALAIAVSGEILWTIQTELSGRIPEAPAGALGFGYDPVFFVPELGRTLAELTLEEKNRISARGRALAGLRQFLAEL